MRRMLKTIILLLLSSLALGYTPSYTYNPSWSSPSTGPGKTQGGKPTYQDAMPLGNGALTALAWANLTNGGAGLYIGHQQAMSSHTELFKLAVIQISLTPNPYAAGSYFNQTVDFATGTVSIFLGGSSMQTATALLSIWVDANSDALFVDVSSPSGQTFSLSATVKSVRPSVPTSYTPAFGFCSPIQTQPDVFVDPLPNQIHLHAPRPQTPQEEVFHASGYMRPSRVLSQEGRLPKVGSFQPGSVIIYHRNFDSDGLTVNMTLSQQGIPQLIATTPDWWRDNQFGFVLDGGSGPQLVRSSPSVLTSSSPSSSFQLRFTVLVVQTDTPEDWLADLSARVSTSVPSPKAASDEWWLSFWTRSWIVVNETQTTGDGFAISRMIAITRYTQAIQSRNTIIPIKFNGMAFIAAMEDGALQADSRDWGPSNWWQNTRLPYGSMVLAGDYDLQAVILDYYMNLLKLLGPRTQVYWNHSGMWTTETHHLSGAYDMSDYGCGRPSSNPKYPVNIMESGYLHVDQGGDSGTGEYALMALDYYLWFGSQKYLPLAFAAADYFMGHYAVNSTTGRVVVFPAQVLETYWCDFDTTTQEFVNCCSDDSPTISGMYTLFEKLLQLPPTVSTPAQRAAWSNFFTRPLIPELPVVNGLIVPARILQNGGHNSEGPELYAMHPHRWFTKGREVASGKDISVGVNTHLASGWAKNNNDGWTYGINSAALLGLTNQAAAQVIERANTGPASGYRFPGFSPHFQDFDPSADHFANFMRAAQEMILQSGEDGFDSTTIVLFPSWPCQWDLKAKLWGPLNTTVEIDFSNSKLNSLVVTPSSRANSVKWANCV